MIPARPSLRSTPSPASPSLALVALAASLAAGGCAARATERAPAFARVGTQLGAHVAKDGCAYDAATLAAAAARAFDPWREADRLAPHFRCLALRDEVTRDARAACLPDATPTLRAPLARGGRVDGDLAYVGLVPREYAYDLLPRAGSGFEVVVRVQLKGPLASDPAEIARVQGKLEEAARLWTRHAPDGAVSFRFVAQAEDSPAPHFDVALVPGAPRTPFDVAWGREWSAHLIAHEVGHMMGLDDEYGQLRKTLGHALGREPRWLVDVRAKLEWLRCDPRSLMCDSKGEQSVPLPYHYWAILRRRFCPVVPRFSVF